MNGPSLTISPGFSETPAQTTVDLSSAPLEGVDQRIQSSVAYLKDHLDSPLQVAALAALAGISAPWFYVLFKKETGCSPIEFFIRLRMQRGCELLRETDLPVKAVAGMLGYRDSLYFSRLFKSVLGISPSRFRSEVADGDFPGGEYSAARAPRSQSFSLAVSS